VADGARVICNPSDDGDFVASVGRIAASSSDAEQLQDRLRATYPKAVVHRSVLAGDPHGTWYVYRDGQWAGDGSGLIEAGEHDGASARVVG
jgi:hypothetical protein